jgi:hypothetical protein
MTIAGLAMILSIAPFLLMRQSPEVKSANRIHDQYLAAQAPALNLSEPEGTT